MVQTCAQCGAVNGEGALTCCFCDTQLASSDGIRVPVGVSSAGSSGVTTPRGCPPGDADADWRLELSQRLAAYRARRRRLSPAGLQAALPFPNGHVASVREPERKGAPFIPRTPRASPARSKSRKVERVEIDVSQPLLNFAGAEQPRSDAGASLFPVAALGERLRAGLLDAAFLLLSYAGFLAMFRSFGGQFTFGKFGALVYAITLFLFYAQYFGLFTAFGFSTPGMLLRGLRVVSFDGSAPTPRQFRWRAFGYLVSAGTVFLGFLWALWDEDRLTWQDRISQTYLAQAPAHTEPASPAAAPPLLTDHRRLAQK